MRCALAHSFCPSNDIRRGGSVVPSADGENRGGRHDRNDTRLGPAISLFFLQSPELKHLALYGFFDRFTREIMGRCLVRPDHAGNSPRAVVFREFVSTYVPCKCTQLPPRL